MSNTTEVVWLELWKVEKILMYGMAITNHSIMDRDTEHGGLVTQQEIEVIL